MNLTKSIIISALLMMLISVPAFPQDLNVELFEAAKNDQSERVKSLLAAGAEVDAKDEKGITALLYASSEGHPQTVEALLDAGAEVDAPANDGMTALMVVAKGNTEIAQALLDAGADVEARTQRGVTPLMVAVATGNTKIVQILLDVGADVDAEADHGLTALMMTERNGYFEIAELLKSAGAIVPEPRLREETLLANGLLAVTTVKDIVVAQITYSATDGEGEYARNFPELAEAGLISSELATGLQDGYQFATNGEGETFTVNADPILVDETGTRHLFADESGVIRWSMEGPATVVSPAFEESEPDAE